MKASATVRTFVYTALALLTFYVYSDLAGFGFINFDDEAFVYKNRSVQSGLCRSSVKAAFTTLQGGHWIPMTVLSLTLDGHLFGTKASGYHCVNILFHVMNSLMLLYLLEKMTDRFWPSAFVAALFALHPLHVESVAWISERKDVLSAFFWMLASCAYVRYVREPGFAFTTVVLLFALGLLSKAIVITLPCVFLLLDYWPLGRFSRIPAYRLIREKGVMFLLSFAFGLLAILTQRAAGGLSSLGQVPLYQRLATAMFAYGKYLLKVFIPYDLCLLYVSPPGGPPLHQALAAGLLVAAITYFVCHPGRAACLRVGWLWYLCTLLPVTGLFQTGPQSMADRYMYLPLIGIGIMIAWGAADLLSGLKYSEPILALSAILVLAGSVTLSRNQVLCWRDSETVYKQVLKVDPRNILARNYLACHYMDLGRSGEAKAELEKALRDKPGFEMTYMNLGLLAMKMNKPREALKYFTEATRLEPSDAKAFNNRAVTLARLGRFKEAVESFRRALQLDPGHWSARRGLATALKSLEASK